MARDYFGYDDAPFHEALRLQREWEQEHQPFRRPWRRVGNAIYAAAHAAVYGPTRPASSGGAYSRSYDDGLTVSQIQAGQIG